MRSNDIISAIKLKFGLFLWLLMSLKVIDIIQYNSVLRDGIDSEIYAALVLREGVGNGQRSGFLTCKGQVWSFFLGLMSIKIMDIIGYNDVSLDCAQWHTGF